MSDGVSRQRHKVRRGGRRSAGESARARAGHPHARRHAPPLPLPLHRPHAYLPHRRDHRCGGTFLRAVPRPRHGCRLRRSGTQTPLHGLRAGPDGLGRAGVVPGHQVDREADRGRTRVPRLRTAVVLPRGVVDGPSRTGDRRTGPLAQGRERDAGHLPFDRETLERAGRERHVPDRLQPLDARAGTHRRPAARSAAHPLRTDSAARGLLQHPLPPVAGAAASGAVPAEVRRAARRAAQHPVPAHGAAGQERRLPLSEGREGVQHLLQRKTALPAHGSAEARDPRNPAGHRDGIPDEPPPAGRRGQRQDPRGADVDAAGCGQRIPGLHDGSHGDSRPPALHDDPPDARGNGGDDGDPHRRLEGPRTPRGARKESPRAG